MTIGRHEGKLIAFIRKEELTPGQLIRLIATDHRQYFADIQGNIYSYDPFREEMKSMKPTESSKRYSEPTVLIQRKKRYRVKELIARAVFPNVEFGIDQIKRFDGDCLNNALTNIYIEITTSVNTEVGREENCIKERNQKQCKSQKQ